MASPERNKQLIREWFEAVRKGNLDFADQLIAPDYVNHTALPGQSPGPEGVKRAWNIVLQALPDIELTLDLVIAERDLVCFRYSIRGTHHGDFLGNPPTGRPVEFTGTALVRFEGERVREGWVIVDLVRALEQIGAMPRAARAA